MRRFTEVRVRVRVYGLEVFLRKKLSHNFSGWLAYTLSRAERTDAEGRSSRLFDYDQTHILTISGQYQLPKNWSLGARWRYVSGTPFTPALRGVFVESRDAFEPILGRVNSERMGDFHALDVRLDKTWDFRLWQLTAYLSVANVYNQANPEQVAYAYDYRSYEEVNGLPILPILGLSAEL